MIILSDKQMKSLAKIEMAEEAFSEERGEAFTISLDREVSKNQEIHYREMRDHLDYIKREKRKKRKQFKKFKHAGLLTIGQIDALEPFRK